MGVNEPTVSWWARITNMDQSWNLTVESVKNPCQLSWEPFFHKTSKHGRIWRSDKLGYIFYRSRWWVSTARAWPHTSLHTHAHTCAYMHACTNTNESVRCEIRRVSHDDFPRIWITRCTFSDVLKLTMQHIAKTSKICTSHRWTVTSFSVKISKIGRLSCSVSWHSSKSRGITWIL